MPTGNATLLTNAKIFADGIDLSGQANQVGWAGSANMLDRTTYESEGWTESVPGLRSSTINVTTYLDEALTAQALNPGASGLVVTVAESNDLGAYGYAVTANTATLGQDWQVGSLVGQPIAFQGDGAAIAGRLLLPRDARTAGANGNAVALGLVASGRRARASLHVLSITGGNVAVKVQSDDSSGFPSPTDRITFTTTTAPGAEMLTTDGSAITDTQWRVTWTQTASSVTFAVLVGIH